MYILGNRVLVSPVEKEKVEGFQTVQVQDSFVYMGKVEKLGQDVLNEDKHFNEELPPIRIGDTIIFAKYSPDTHEIEHEGKKFKSVKVEDILAVL